MQGREAAIDYYKRKIEFVGKEVQNIERIGGEKKGQLYMIMQALKQAQPAA